jgi:hypothetical protein
MICRFVHTRDHYFLYVARSSTAASASTSVIPKRSNSAQRPATADGHARPGRSSAADTVSVTTVRKRTCLNDFHSISMADFEYENA